MKTVSLLALAAAFVAFATLPFVFEITAAALFCAGLAALVLLDYGRALRRVRLPVALPVPARSERFGLAA